MPRLTHNSLPDASRADLPVYQRRDHGRGIVHLGCGAFHRAHQAVYTDTVLNLHGGDWLITGASLRSAGVQQLLAPQNYYYTVWSRDQLQSRFRVVGAIAEVLTAGQESSQIIDAIAHPDTHIVSLTITEKGYLYTPDGGLDTDHPDIKHDIAHQQPGTAPGFIVRGLKARMKDGAGPLTLLSCDNLEGNGRIIGNVVGSLAAIIDPALCTWIEDNVSFPSTMVDRIVPATTEEERQQASRQLGVDDAAIVVCETHSQWVIEDQFAADRPRWEDAGALLVTDVTPFETAKLRLLNGAHSSCAYIGYLCGYDYVHQAVLDPVIRKLLEDLMQEAMPGLTAPVGLDLEHYCATILDRFANQALPYRTTQVAMDGSKKLPQRLLATLRQRLAQGANVDRLCFSIAAWARYVSGVDDHGQPIVVKDPLAERLARVIAEHPGDAHAQVQALSRIEAIFGDLRNSELFLDRTGFWLDRILSVGTRRAAESLVKQS